MINNGANAFLAPSPVVPHFLLITNITNSSPMVVTVSTENEYVVGQLVHFFIPSSYGMIQLDQKTGSIVAINGLNFYVDIDSSQFDVFVTPSTYEPQPASLTSGGSRNIYNVTTVPFRSLNGNVGN